MKHLFFTVSASLLMLLGACFSGPKPDPSFEPKESDKLTKDEMDSIIWHAQQFISSNKMLRLGKAHRAMIQKNAPVVRVAYSAPKYGKIELEWPISADTVVLLSSRGDLLASRQPWILEIMTGANKGGLTDAELEEWRNIDSADDFDEESEDLSTPIEYKPTEKE